MIKGYIKIVKSIVVLSFVMVISSFSNSVLAGLHSGTICKAANLSQALNLGLGHNQNGANNNGTGNFFVVCPLDYEESSLFSADLIQVGVRFPSGGGTIACTARGQQAFTETFAFESIDITSTTTAGAALVNIAPAWVGLSGQQTNATLVCALGPGESIKWILFRSTAP